MHCQLPTLRQLPINRQRPVVCEPLFVFEQPRLRTACRLRYTRYSVCDAVHYNIRFDIHTGTILNERRQNMFEPIDRKDAVRVFYRVSEKRARQLAAMTGKEFGTTEARK